MINHRLSLKLLLGALFAGTILCCSFVQPFRPDTILKPIPNEATFVFKAGSLEELLQSPVCRQLNNALGAGNSLREITDSNGWIRLAASSEIAVADIPFRSAGRNKSWVAVSWVGWRSPWLRWKLEGSRSKRLYPVGEYAVWPIWRYDSPELARGMVLTFSLTDNVLIVCLSESANDIKYLLSNYDQRIPSAKHRKGSPP